MKVYHYTNPLQWERTKLCSDYNQRALLPLRRVVLPTCASGLESKAYESCAIFCFPQAQPDSWLKNDEFPQIWNNLLGNIRSFQGKLTLLSFTLTPEENAFIVDRAHVERYLHMEYLGDDRDKFERNKAYGAYWESKVFFSDYAGDYSLPEVIVLAEISVERITEEWSGQKSVLLEKILSN